MHNAKKGTYRYAFLTFTSVRAAKTIEGIKNFRFRGKKMAVKAVNKKDQKLQNSIIKCPIHDKFLEEAPQRAPYSSMELRLEDRYPVNHADQL